MLRRLASLCAGTTLALILPVLPQPAAATCGPCATGLEEWPVPFPMAAPQFITAGPAGTNSLWTTSTVDNYVYELDATDAALLNSVEITDADYGMGAIATGPDGNVYVADPSDIAQQSIAKITSAGALSHVYITPPAGTKAVNPWAITAGPPGDSGVYFTVKNGPTRLGRVDTGTSALSWLSLADAANDFAGAGWTVTTGPDSAGNQTMLWFMTEGGTTSANTIASPAIGRMSANGQNLQLMATLGSSAQVWSMVPGTSGPSHTPGMWYSDYMNNLIGFIPASGGSTTPVTYPLPTYGSLTDVNDKDGKGPRGIRVGPDGWIYVSVRNSNRIEMFDPTTGSWASDALRTPDQPVMHPLDMTAGPDGNLWYVSVDQSRVGRVIFNEPAAPGVDRLSPFTLTSGLSSAAMAGTGSYVYLEKNPSGAASLKTTTVHGFPMGIAPDPPTFIDGTGYLEVVMAGSEFLQRLPFNLATPFKAGLAPTQDPYRAVKLSSGGRPQMLVTGVNGTDVWVTAAVNDSVLQVQENVPQAGQEEVTLHESDTGVGGLAFTDCRYRTMLAVAPDDSSKEVCLAGFGGIAQQDSSNLWVTEFTNSRAANVTTSGGVITDVGDDLPSGDAGAIDVASTPGGDMWFTEFKAGNIASRPKGKQFSEIAIPGCDNCGPYGITAGPAQLGGIWFTEQRSNEVVEMNTATNTFHSWMLPTANSQPTGITAAPDGSLYVTEYAAGKVAKLTVDPTTWAGAWTEYTLPYDARSYPYWITAGPAVPGLPESLWVTLPYRDQVAEICFPGCP